MPQVLTFPRITDPRGSLSFAQDLPFAIKRVYWIFDLSSDAVRGAHAHKQCQRILIAISGSFNAVVDGATFRLSKPWIGLWIKPGEFLDLNDFSGGAACIALASHEYDESDYIRARPTWNNQPSIHAAPPAASTPTGSTPTSGVRSARL